MTASTIDVDYHVLRDLLTSTLHLAERHGDAAVEVFVRNSRLCGAATDRYVSGVLMMPGTIDQPGTKEGFRATLTRNTIKHLLATFKPAARQQETIRVQTLATGEVTVSNLPPPAGDKSVTVTYPAAPPGPAELPYLLQYLLRIFNEYVTKAKRPGSGEARQSQPVSLERLTQIRAAAGDAAAWATLNILSASRAPLVVTCGADDDARFLVAVVAESLGDRLTSFAAQNFLSDLEETTR